MATGESKVFGSGHTNEVTAVAIAGDTVVSCAMDDTVRFTPKGSDTLGPAIKLESQPQGIATSGSLTIVVSLQHVTVFRDGTNNLICASPRTGGMPASSLSMSISIPECDFGVFRQCITCWRWRLASIF